MPVYVVDILIAVTFVLANRVPRSWRGNVPFSAILVTILFFAILGELNAAALSGQLLQPIYIIVRTLIAFSLFYSVSRIVQTSEDVELLLKCCVIGLTVTALLMVLTSLPFTRGPVVSSILSNTFLEPAADSVTRRFDGSEGAMRGRSLVGVSILSGAFINILWPLGILLYLWPREIGRWRQVAMIACFIAPFGVLMSYSRGAILGMFLVTVISCFMASKQIRNRVLAATLVFGGVVLVVGPESEAFFFDRLERRLHATINAPYEDEREWERILAYVEPFEHLIENPSYLVIGEGNSIGRVGVRAEQVGKATHAVFAKAYYVYGMVAAFLYVFLLIGGLREAARQARLRRRSRGIDSVISQAIFASMVGLVPWFVFGHAAVSAPRGAMIMMFLFGLLVALRHFPYLRHDVRTFSNSPPNHHVKARVSSVHGRYTTVR